MGIGGQFSRALQPYIRGDSIQQCHMILFSQAVCEKIGFYIYILKDPRTKEVFYVGKG